MPLPTFFNLPTDKQSRIIECSIDEFAEWDYESASISKIVLRAGISKGSLYQYFRDKQDLYRYILDLSAKKKAAVLADSSSTINQPGFYESLHLIFRVMARFELENPKLASIARKLVLGKSPLPEEVKAGAKQSTHVYFCDLIERGKATGDIRPDVETSHAAFLFAAALANLGDLLATLPPEELTGGDAVETAYKSIINLLKFGISTSEPKSRKP